MADERPKPKYGELAPEGWSWTPPSDAHPDSPATADAGAGAPEGVPGSGSGSDSTGKPAGTPRWPAPTTPPVQPGADAGRADAGTGAPEPGVPGAPTVPKRGDRIATMILLVIGAFWSINSAFGMFSLPEALQQAMDILGIEGTYTARDTANSAGVTGGVLTLLTYALTVVYSLRRVRANKLAFFVPLIGAFIAFVISFTVYIIAMTADPALMDGILRTAP